MEVQDIKKRLIEGGYSISPRYGLILENGNTEYVIADIRISEENVVLPYWNEKETKEVSKLKKILIEKEIPFREVKRGEEGEEV